MPRVIALLAVATFVALAAPASTALSQERVIAIEIPAKFPISFPAVSPSTCWKVARPADGRITAEVTGPGDWNVCIGDDFCPSSCGGPLRSASTEPLTHGSYYYVKVEARSPGATATLSIYPSGGGAAAPTSASGADLRGSWRWTCCRGLHSGTFQIATQKPDGTFSGRFGDTSSDNKTPLSGRLTLAGVEFTRTITPPDQNQVWTAQLGGTSGSSRMINGNWSGVGFVAGYGDFQAERIGTASSPALPTASSPALPTASSPALPTAATGIVGRWTWSCCKGTSSGSFTISEQDTAGRIRGVFGNSPADGATPFEGTYSGGQLVFTRMLTINGTSQQQVWRARVAGSGSSLHTTDGQFSGFGAVAGYTDIQATFVGGR